ncbi:MAG TPA: hypothetical protein VE404_08395, partial [Verrucomicrobiae bacterium]|nr:hypothetical protein [Verrucomicrobiae bacterium]
FSLADLKAEIREGSMRPRAGWISRRFGARTPAPHVSFAASTQLPARIVTILMPLAEGNGPAPAAYPVIVEGPRLAGVVVGDGRDFIGIEEQGLSLRRG